MNNKTELINILRAELTLLTKDILNNVQQKGLDDLYQATRKLYEKMAAIQVLEKQLSKEDLLSAFQIQTEKEKTDEPIIYKTDEKPEKTIENPYKVARKISFKPKDNQNKEKPQTAAEQNYTIKKMNIGLNDRIAFIKNLFNGDSDIYQQTIDQLNSFESYEEGLLYINNVLKPKFDNWENKDEYEFRLLQLFELKFN